MNVIIEQVLARCDSLKLAGVWPSASSMDYEGWLNNFDSEDSHIAALLLDRFTYYNQEQTNALFVSAYNSIGDGLQKGPEAPLSKELIISLQKAVFTLVTGESPNVSDSGFTFCRIARQKLRIPEDLLVEPKVALEHARRGGTVVFLDDFIGSGDQFLNAWRRPYDGQSFKAVQDKQDFTALYIALVSTDFGLSNIHSVAPKVAVCTAHVIGDKSKLSGLDEYKCSKTEIDNFLAKYAKRLTPKDNYIATKMNYKMYGYKNRKLLLAFEHSVPDATLPIFWSEGTQGWRCLIERA